MLGWPTKVISTTVLVVAGSCIFSFIAAFAVLDDSDAALLFCTFIRNADMPHHIGAVVDHIDRIGFGDGAVQGNFMIGLLGNIFSLGIMFLRNKLGFLNIADHILRGI